MGANSSLLALDVGDVRIGVAVANAEVRFPRPLTTLANDEVFLEKLTVLLQEHEVIALIVGLPRGLQGQETAQTQKVQQFVAMLHEKLDIPIHLQDEAATSLKAEKELTSRGKPYAKADIDALAANYILEDYILEARRTA